MHALGYRKFATKLLLVCAILVVAFALGSVSFFFMEYTTVICSRSPCGLASCCNRLVAKERTLVPVINKYIITYLVVLWYELTLTVMCSVPA